MPQAPVSGTVFKIERGTSGEKVAYARLFGGTVRVRDHLAFGPGNGAKVTSIAVFDRGSLEQRREAYAGQIAKLWGLGDVRTGESIGVPPATPPGSHFAPPTLEAVVVPRHAVDKGALHNALTQLAEQEPLINLRQDDVREELYVSLYGEVQKEVIEATLANDFGIDVEFREATMICIERPIATGHAVEVLQAETHPFSATVGLRVDPAPAGSGVVFPLDVDQRRIPLYIYKSLEKFTDAMSQYIRSTLREGLFGWQVTDCLVTMVECGYYVGDGPTKPVSSTPRTTAAHFRKLTPLVLMAALERARTMVCEPIMRVSIEIPTDALNAVVAAVTRLDGVVEPPAMRGELTVFETSLPAAQAQASIRQFRSLASGEGVVTTCFDGYQPVRGTPPRRRRTLVDPLDRKEHLLQVMRRVERGSSHG
jgi:ribosomal protection tetracycline resistance protein